MENNSIVENAVKDGGAYEIIKKRLVDKGLYLSSKVEKINKDRKSEFGGSKLEILSKVKFRTDNNCTPVDMAQLNNLLIVGYDVNVGLKSKVSIDDVFILYEIIDNNGSLEFKENKTNRAFLNDSKFVQSFNSLINFYPNAKLKQISRINGYFYIVYQTGSKETDVKVFKWQILGDLINYIDDNSHNEYINSITEQSHDFKWIKTTRDDQVDGVSPHISILDKVFVETIRGDLTIKIENNTESGKGIYSEPVDNELQTLADGEYYYAEVGNLILLKIKPYQENNRFFVYNTTTETVFRNDSIGYSCKELPENQGLIFPQGYYLKNGESKVFKTESESLKYFQCIASPNGEDYLYIYFDFISLSYVLYPYNMIDKSVPNPIHANGYSVYNNGNLAVFRNSENDNQSKIHPLTIWLTPFFNDVFYDENERNKSGEGNQSLIKIGNAELVSAISELYTLLNFIKKEEVSTSLYETIIKNSNILIDDYHWISDEEFGNIKEDLKDIINISELVVEEFEKVKSMQLYAEEKMLKIEEEHKELKSKIKLTSQYKTTEYISLLEVINKHIGLLVSSKVERYIDLEKLEIFEEETYNEKSIINNKLLVLLQDKSSFSEYFNDLKKIENNLANASKVVEVNKLEKEITNINNKINIVNTEVNEIETEDSTVKTIIIEHLSEVFAFINKINAKIKNTKKSFLSKEAKKEFASQFKLLTQSVSNSLSKADTPENCDKELSYLIGILDKLETSFSDFDDYLTDIYEKRNEINNTFENQKQQLINNIQKRIINIVKAGNINIESISKKVEKFSTIEDLNTYFTSDIMVSKLRSLITQIKELGGTTQAEDLESKLVKIKDMSMRSLRDNKDIFEDNGNVMKMGKHRFPVNKTPLDLTIINKDGRMHTHLTSTEYFNTIENDDLIKLKEMWEAELPSENEFVYRSEYLAYLILDDAINYQNDLSLDILKTELHNNKLMDIIHSYSDTRYKDNYIKGVHDTDAELILEKLIPLYDNAGELMISQDDRAIALLSFLQDSKESIKTDSDIKKIENAKYLKDYFNDNSKWNEEKNKMISVIETYFKNTEITDDAAEFLLILFSNKKFECSIKSEELSKKFSAFTKKENINLIHKENINLEESYATVQLWMKNLLLKENNKEMANYIKEASAIYIYNELTSNENLSSKDIHISVKNINLSIFVNNLIGEHKTIIDGEKTIVLDDFMKRLKEHKNVYYPNFEKFVNIRKNVANKEKELLCLEDFKSNPLTSFVRNKLITDVYLPMIGDNFAKQMGTMGENKRTDLMGLLLLISPPGYGKTTLIEYVANKLGLVFVKVNCPSIGHSVTSLDPNEATDSNSIKEINKINMAFEMGSNVLLYLDDIQHTNPEFLQKFISLCDGTRKIEGVWNGKNKTYDMKGKKFSVVMAGNPYTESGDKFQIPDMLANRADIYNLGDILGGKVDTFKLSYIENSLTANSVISPLATRSMDDVYKFIKLAKGESIPSNEFDYNYSPSEINEIKDVIKHMLKIQDIVFEVNKEYIKSAATDETFREEPSFKLQGSYRNMNKMTEKLVSVMNDEDIKNLILDHYTGESQTLTDGAEANMLKLKSLMNLLTDEEEKRWNNICKEFVRTRKNGSSNNPNDKIANQLSLIGETLSDLSKSSSKDTFSDSNEYIKSLHNLVDLIKDNQSEEDLISLFSERIEALNKNFILMIEKRDAEQIKIFKPMISYFEAVLKVHKEKNK